MAIEASRSNASQFTHFFLKQGKYRLYHSPVHHSPFTIHHSRLTPPSPPQHPYDTSPSTGNIFPSKNLSAQLLLQWFWVVYKAPPALPSGTSSSREGPGRNHASARDHIPPTAHKKDWDRSYGYSNCPWRGPFVLPFD